MQCRTIHRAIAAAAAAVCGGIVPPAPAAPPAGAGYALVFADEFAGSSLDTMKWNYNYTWGQTHNHRAYMCESQVIVGNGVLNLQAIAQRDPNAPAYVDASDFGRQYLDYTSGAINSSGKFNLTHGYIEARMKMDDTLGSWPAFWTLQNGWPPEIDIMEFPRSASNSASQYWMNYHYTNDSGAHASYGWHDTRSNLTTGYHTYGVEWTSSTMKFYFDGELRHTITDANAIADSANMYLILNHAIGGWAGTPAGSSEFPVDFQTDWVRVWQTRSGDTASDWNVNGGGSWDAAGNWGGIVPKHGNQQVNFARIGNAPTANITWSNYRTVGALIFEGSTGGTTAYTLGTAASGLQFAGDTGGLIAAAANSQTNQTINAKLDLWSNTTARNEMTAGKYLLLNGPIVGPGALTIEGAGIAILGASNSYVGGTRIDDGAQGSAAVRATSSNAFGTGSIVFNPAGNGTAGRLELDSGVSINNPIFLSGRTNASVAIQGIRDDATINGTITATSGGNYYIIQSDDSMLLLTGSAGGGVALRSDASGDRTFTLRGNGTGQVSGAIQNGSGNVGVRKEGTGTWILSGNNSYSGTTAVTAGTLRINGTHSNAGSYVIDANGTLGGHGLISFAGAAGVTNSSIVAPGTSAGSLTIAGNYTQTSTGVLSIELGGTTPGTQYGRLNVLGTVDLAGTIRVKNINGFIPLPGESFDVLTYESPTTDTSTVVNQTPYAGLVFTKEAGVSALSLLVSALYSGDCNLDGQVTISDLGTLASNWQDTANWLGGDFNGDGIVTISDLGDLASNWQAGVGSPMSMSFEQALAAVGFATAVPEPTWTTLFCVCSAGVVSRRWRGSGR